MPGLGLGRGRGLPIKARGSSDFASDSSFMRRPGDLRKPNPANLPTSPYDPKPDNSPPELDDIFKELNSERVDETKLSRVTGLLKSACSTADHAKDAVEKLYNYSLLNKINAHYTALLCKQMGDFQVADFKFKFAFFKRLQIDYEDRKRKYSNLDQFLNIVVVLCEIYHHLRIPNGNCYEIFVVPIIEYLGMLVDGGSEKEIETLAEQVKKCGKDLQSQKPEIFETLLLKIRKQIIAISSVSSRTMLLHTLEMILNHWDPLSTSATNFYDAVCKQINSSCE